MPKLEMLLEKGRVTMLSEYKLILDTGKIAYIKAKSRQCAISAYCAATGVSKEWVAEHCKAENMGRVKW